MNNGTGYTIEACVETYDQALAAQNKGADQIELCARLDLGGTTPDIDLITKCKKQLSLHTKVMIRPRGGDFTYTPKELSQMKKEIELCKEIGVYGVVFGILQDDRLNITQILELAELAQPLNVTIHKAIDDTTDVLSSTKELLKHHSLVNAILTSGGESTAEQGSAQLKQMIDIAGDKIDIIPAGTITDQNIMALHATLGARVYHGRKIVGELSPTT